MAADGKEQLGDVRGEIGVVIGGGGGGTEVVVAVVSVAGISPFDDSLGVVGCLHLDYK